MKKLSKIYEEVSNECDGCQYFDMNSIYDNVEFDKPLYALVSKRRIGKRNGVWRTTTVTIG